ncbi:MAG: DEAD/DEAH box helicase [bacterium]
METLEKFKKLGLSDQTLKALKAKGFEEPSPIQVETIPVLLQGNLDIIGQAQTGTGKTAAFALPIIQTIKENSRHVQAIILTPTRELAIQVAEEINSLKGDKDIRIVPIYGGQAIEQQFKKLTRGVDIVVGTPGRIIDHLDRRTLKLDKVSYMVLDEADEMLNMGFIEDMQEIMEQTNPDKRTLLFSATMPPRIQALAKNYMKEHKFIAIQKERLNNNLTEQIYFEVRQADKFEALCRIIDMELEFYGLIFCRTKIETDDIAKQLIDRGYDAEALHGDVSQSQRERILDKFRKQKITILVATDVAARGIDVNKMTHVINYSLPQDPESYVHRIGRTGRAGNKGTAVTFITPSEYRKLLFIQKEAKTDIRKAEVPKIKDVIRTKRARLTERLIEAIETEDGSDYTTWADTLLEKYEAQKIIGALLKYSFEEQLDESSYGEISSVGSRSSSDRSSGGGRESDIDREGTARLFVTLGRKDGTTKKSLVDLIKKTSKLEDRYISNVSIFEKFAFVTVPFEKAEEIIHSFKAQSKGKRTIVTRAKPREEKRN